MCNGTTCHLRESTIGLDPVWNPITFRRWVVCGYCEEGKRFGGRISEQMEKRVHRRILTEREKGEIRAGLALGLTHQRIADALLISVQAVHSYSRDNIVKEAA